MMTTKTQCKSTTLLYTKCSVSERISNKNHTSLVTCNARRHVKIYHQHHHHDADWSRRYSLTRNDSHVLS